MGPGEFPENGDVRLFLYRAEVLKEVWETMHPFALMGPEMVLALGGPDEHRVSKGAAQVQASRLPGIDAREITEIGALNNYGPMIFDLALVAAGDVGMVPDRHLLSPQAKRFLSKSRATKRYDLERLPERWWQYRGNRTLDSIWRLKPAHQPAVEDQMGLLRAAQQVAFESIDWDVVQIESLTAESFDQWMQGAYHAFFRNRYHGTNRGRGRG
jgi:hypothetical protein